MNRDTLGEVVDRVMQRHGSRLTNLVLVDDKPTRTFRGVAFVSFATFREASIALEEMAKVVINGRKVIAEFHRRAPATPKVTTTNQTPTNATSILPSPKQTSKNQSKPQPQPHPLPPPPIEQNVILDDNENCSPVNHSPVDNANQNNRTNNITANNDHTTPKQMDKRAQFFANRDHERKTKRQTQHVSGEKERERERDRVLESEFRNLLIDYSKGSIRNPNVPKLVTDGDAEDDDADASDNPVPESSGIEAKSDDDSSGKDDSAVTEDNVGDNGDDHAKDDYEKNKTNSNVTKSPPANAKMNRKRAGCDEVQDLVFDSTLTSYERRMVHSICDELNLGHISRYDNDGRRILRVTRDPTRAAEWTKEASSVMNSHKAAMENKHNHHTPTNGSSTKQANQNVSTSVNSISASPSATSTSVNSNGGGGLTKKLNFYRPRDVDGGENGGGILPPSYKIYTPKRQPSGPPGDATNVGFATRIKFHNDKTDKKSPTSAKKVNKKQQQSPTGSGSSKSSNGHNNGRGGNGTTNAKKQSKKQSSLNPSLPSFSPMNGVGMGNNGNGL